MVRRGGSWDELSGNCNVSERERNNPNFKNDNSGFRLALDVSEAGMIQPSPHYGEPPQEDYPQQGYLSQPDNTNVNNAAFPAVRQAQYQTQYQEDFTGGQRFATWILNGLVPGIGSLAVMQDGVGAVTQWVLLGGGIILMVNGWDTYEETRYNDNYYYNNGYGSYYSSYPETYTETEPNAWYFIGLVAVLSKSVYNIARSATYKKKISRNAASFENSGLNVAVLPDKNGNIKGCMAYSLGF